MWTLHLSKESSVITAYVLNGTIHISGMGRKVIKTSNSKVFLMKLSANVSGKHTI